MESKSNKSPEPTQPKTRQRSRKPDGKYEGGSQAWEATEVEAALEKKIDVSIKPKVEGASSNAGKYKKRHGIRPTFGNVVVITEH
jgi:hypothetical protein